ncbi:hypothetical protein [Aureliella helgolandensis]|uniref:Uncharacterized protein n=1 Tax=Aureliella helgolandensis TaxID=2527968 RepID=A0A518GFC0_9BACT|nr:hypothetical protein [Aureliella helgolandensis]QDV27250.1 hypothetical protein Q31a_56380 [Aureliella helgolandensis]
MKRFLALIRETWWLWLLFLGFGTVMSMFSPIFLVTFPICTCVFFWFGFIRYDDEGNFKGS